MAEGKNRTLRVGVFVILGLVLATLAIFVIGDNRRQWDRKTSYRAKFTNVGGLKPGAGVRIGGIDVGQVSEVTHADDAKDMIIYVTFSVAKNEAGRVKPDTQARIVGRGLLGDKMIELVGGDPAAKPAADGTFIASEEEPADLGKAMADVQDAVKSAKASLENVRVASEKIADPQFTQDLRTSAKSLADILDGVAHKNGAAHDLIFDPNEAARINHIITNLDTTTANLAQVSANARDITDRAKTGPGLAHTLVYDEKSGDEVAGTLAELHGALTAMRTGNGLGHMVIYGDDKGSSQHLMTNLATMSDDMKEIVANVKAGRGTLGALLVDPSVYEDIKSLVGNVERNQVLRALVRYSIKKDETAHAEVKEEKK